MSAKRDISRAMQERLEREEERKRIEAAQAQAEDLRRRPALASELRREVEETLDVLEELDFPEAIISKRTRSVGIFRKREVTEVVSTSWFFGNYDLGLLHGDRVSGRYELYSGGTISHYRSPLGESIKCKPEEFAEMGSLRLDNCLWQLRHFREHMKAKVARDRARAEAEAWPWK